MKIYITLSEIKRGIFFGFCLTLLFAIFGADGLLPAPKLSSLEIFTGNIENVELLKNKRTWKVALESSSDRRVFYVPLDLCRTLENDVIVGETATARLYRPMPLGSIIAWQLEASGKEILSYEESKERRQSPKDFLFSLLIAFLGISVGGILLEIGRRSKRNS